MYPQNTTKQKMGIGILIYAMLLILFISCNENSKVIAPDTFSFQHTGKPRVAAEWEPAKGVMFACPPIIPKELIIEFAKDTHIYPIVNGEEEKAEAKAWFEKWEIDLNRVHFITLKTDVDILYLRDWGPAAVFLNDDNMKLVDADFINSDPFSGRDCNDTLELQIADKTGLNYYSTLADSSIVPLANQLDFETHRVHFTNTGGNVLTDGIGTAFSTCISLIENRYNGVTDNQFYALADSLLGYHNYHIISNFESHGIQHIDCFLKIIDEETILVSQAPEDHELYEIYENIVQNELTQLKNPFGRKYKIKRIQLSRIVEEYLTAYSNSLILNETVYVPMYDVQTDSMALETWQSVMPGYTIKGIPFLIDEQEYLIKSHFEGYEEVGASSGWANDDALHCRTRAVWDENMTFIAVDRISSEQLTTKETELNAMIIDYSNPNSNNLVANVYWRVKGTKEWNIDTMINNDNYRYSFSDFPSPKPNTVIEYYVEAKSTSGKSVTRPITAPNGYFEFKYISE